MEPLVARMVQDDPLKRPTMDTVVTEFRNIRDSLSSRKLRSRIVPRQETQPTKAILNIIHWYRRIGYIFTRKPAIPIY
jgi:hypothetical protein